MTNKYPKVATYYDDITFEVGTTGQARCEATKNKVAEEERTVIYEDDSVSAFQNMYSRYSLDISVVPKKHIQD